MANAGVLGSGMHESRTRTLRLGLAYRASGNLLFQGEARVLLYSTVSGLEVRVLLGSPAFSRNFFEHHQLTLFGSSEPSLDLGTSGNKTPATRSTARRCQSGIARMYVRSVVSRSL